MPHRIPPYVYLIGNLKLNGLADASGYVFSDGEVRLYEKQHRHAAGIDKPAGDQRVRLEQYRRTFPHVGYVISHPQYYQLDGGSSKTVALISFVSSDQWPLLVGLTKNPDKHGIYRVITFYPISQRQFDSRLRQGRIIHI